MNLADLPDKQLANLSAFGSIMQTSYYPFINGQTSPKHRQTKHVSTVQTVQTVQDRREKSHTGQVPPVESELQKQTSLGLSKVG